jgi:hypothetical protein
MQSVFFLAHNSALKKMYPGEYQSNVAHHLTTLAAMICGIIRSQKTNLPEIASEVPENTSLPVAPKNIPVGCFIPILKKAFFFGQKFNYLSPV